MEKGRVTNAYEALMGHIQAELDGGVPGVYITAVIKVPCEGHLVFEVDDLILREVGLGKFEYYMGYMHVGDEPIDEVGRYFDIRVSVAMPGLIHHFILSNCTVVGHENDHRAIVFTAKEVSWV